MGVRSAFFGSLILFFLALIVQVLPSKLFAHAKSEKIAVVDINEIFQTSMVTVNLNEQLQAKQSELKKQFESKEKELRSLEKSIETQRGVITESALQEKMNAFNDSVADTQSSAKMEKLAIEKAYFSTLENINNKLKDIIAKHSLEQGIEIVLHKAQVIYRAGNYPDITSAVIAKLNKDFPYIKMADVEGSSMHKDGAKK